MGGEFEGRAGELRSPGPPLKVTIAMTHSTEHKIISREEAARWVRGLQGQGLKVVFTNGCFDLLHPGHVAYLEEARSLGDALLVAVNTDASVRRLGKGGQRPVNPEADRARVLAGLSAVDRVVLFEEDTPLEVLTELQPDILVKGGDYQANEVVGREVILARGGQVLILPFRAGYSTSLLMQRLRAAGD
jgi:rfaE bifunctional protein nucleotidyltransferase chain/domain